MIPRGNGIASQLGFSSTKRCRVPSRSIKSSESSETAILSQDDNEKERCSLSDAWMLNHARSGIKTISALITRCSFTDGKGGIIVQTKLMWKLLHLDNFESASSDERLFLVTVASHGFRKAVSLGSKLHWKYQRPLQALRAMIGVRDTNCTKRQTEKQQPSSATKTCYARLSGE